MSVSNLVAIYRLLRIQYEMRYGPLPHSRSRGTKPAAAFKILVSAILSARTKDETTAEACRRLFRMVRRTSDLKSLATREIERLIYPVGFYRVKARHLKNLADAIDRQFEGRIPSTLDGLCRLPGVGRKTANLVLTDAFGKPAICVDTHVHRISNRLGLVSTKTPFETEMRLRHILPRRYWSTWNVLLVSFGQTVCRPVFPKCQSCPLAGYCKRVGVK